MLKSLLRGCAAGWVAVVAFCAVGFGETSRIYVGTRVNGIPMRFGLDTGAGVEMCMWRDVADILGLKVKTPDPSSPLRPGEVRFGLSEPLTLNLLGSNFPNSSIAVVEAPAFAKWQIQGLVGWPALRNGLWSIDISSGRTGPLPQLPDLDNWVRYPIVQDSPILAIRVPTGSGAESGIVVIDTGSADAVALSPKLWREWRAEHPRDPVGYHGSFMLASGHTTSEITAAAEWTLDRLKLKDVLLVQADPSEIADHGADYLATLGLGALQRLSLILDGKNGYAYFRAAIAPRFLADYNRLGAVFSPETPDSTQWKAKVLPGTPAWDAGVRDGDVLTKINQVEIQHWQQRPGTWPPFKSLPPSGTPVDLGLLRDKRRVSARVVPQDFLRPGVPPVPPQPRPAEVPDFHFVPPFASVLRKADALKLPLRDAQVVTDAAPSLHKDDKVSALVTTVEGGRMQQWLVLFVNTELKPAERNPGQPMRVFTSTGRELTFERMPTGVAVRAVGPFTQADSDAGVNDKWSGAILDGRSLMLGFDGVAASLMKLMYAGDVSFGFGPAPLAAADAAAARAALEQAGFGLEDERAFISGAGALMEFFRIAAQTPGVRDVLRQLLDLSWKDYLRSPNISIDYRMPMEEISAEWWGLPWQLPCRTLTFHVILNGEPKLVCRVAAVHPSRPLETVAGIVGIAVGRVDGTGPHVMVRILGASPAAE